MEWHTLKLPVKAALKNSEPLQRMIWWHFQTRLLHLTVQSDKNSESKTLQYVVSGAKLVQERLIDILAGICDGLGRSLQARRRGAHDDESWCAEKAESRSRGP